MDKAFIISEIKRTADANGRVPLGQDRFEAETGIRRVRWFGKYWARWGEAVREAGYEPNALNCALDEDHLLEKVCAFVREIGRFPAAGDMLIKSRRDETFPDRTTFQRRFGAKSQFIERVREYGTRHGYEDVVRICGVAGPQPSQAEQPSVKPIEELGSVYLLKSGRFYKIGRTISPGQRERQLQIALPERATIVHEFRTDDPVGIEAYWHRRFEAKHKNGEWFELAPEDVIAFKRRRKFM